MHEIINIQCAQYDSMSVQIFYRLCYCYLSLVLAVHLRDSLREKTVLMSGCFGVQSSVATPRGEKFKQFVARV